MAPLKTATRYLYGMLFLLAGVNHFVHAGWYVGIMPPSLPWPLALVYLSGGAEMLLGGLVCLRRWAAVAGWGLVALLLAVFPANIHMAIHADRYSSLPSLV